MKEQACQKREGGLLDVGLLMSCEVAMGWLMGVSILAQASCSNSKSSLLLSKT